MFTLWWILFLHYSWVETKSTRVAFTDSILPIRSSYTLDWNFLLILFKIQSSANNLTFPGWLGSFVQVSIWVANQSVVIPFDVPNGLFPHSKVFSFKNQQASTDFFWLLHEPLFYPDWNLFRHVWDMLQISLNLLLLHPTNFFLWSALYCV